MRHHLENQNVLKLLSKIEKLEIQDCNSPDTVYYYLHMKNTKKYRLDTESFSKYAKN